VPPMDALDQAQFDAFDVRAVKNSTKRMIASVVSRIDIRDLLQSFAFFDVLEKLGPTALNAKANELEVDAFRAFSTHKFAHSERTANDWNLLWRELGCKGDVTQILRAICAVSVVCHSNRSWQDNVHWFGDDRLKQLFDDPQSVLSHIHRNFLKRQVVVKAQPFCRTVPSVGGSDPKSLHKGLPDAVDAFGNLPQLRCAYSRCAMEFASREELLAHVKRSRGGHLTRRLHKNCRSVLQPNPQMSFVEFNTKVKTLWRTDRRPAKALLRAYYEQMQPIFIRNQK